MFFCWCCKDTYPMTRFSRVTILGSWRGMLKRSSFKFKSLYSKRRWGCLPMSVTKFLAFQSPTMCCWLMVFPWIESRLDVLNKPKSLVALLACKFLVELFLLGANPVSRSAGKLLFECSSNVCISIIVFLLPVSNISIELSI